LRRESSTCTMDPGRRSGAIILGSVVKTHGEFDFPLI
jgi:hypothetical protein